MENDQSSVECSICLEVVVEKNGRSTARLQCGHLFHLDCIGSAFNVRGSMQCPNCRVTEAGDWLIPSRGFEKEDLPDLNEEEDLPDIDEDVEDDDSDTDIDPRHIVVRQPCSLQHWCAVNGSWLQEVRSPAIRERDVVRVGNIVQAGAANMYTCWWNGVHVGTSVPAPPAANVNFQQHGWMPASSFALSDSTGSPPDNQTLSSRTVYQFSRRPASSGSTSQQSFAEPVILTHRGSGAPRSAPYPGSSSITAAPHHNRLMGRGIYRQPLASSPSPALGASLPHLPTPANNGGATHAHGPSPVLALQSAGRIDLSLENFLRNRSNGNSQALDMLLQQQGRGSGSEFAAGVMPQEMHTDDNSSYTMYKFL